MAGSNHVWLVYWGEEWEEFDEIHVAESLERGKEIVEEEYFEELPAPCLYEGEQPRWTEGEFGIGEGARLDNGRRGEVAMVVKREVR